MKGPHYQRGFWNFVIPAIAAIGGALLNKEGQESANEANVAQSDKTMAFNREQAELGRIWNQGMWERQRDYNIEMASTQYQRAVGDMQQAGLNPMLAYQQGGNAAIPAPSASSQNASYGNPARIENVTASALSAAGQIISLTNQQKQGENIDADTALKNAQANRETASASNIVQQTAKLQQDIYQVLAQTSLIYQQQTTETKKQQVLEAERTLKETQNLVEKGRIPLVAAQARLDNALSKLRELDVPKSETYNKLWSVPDATLEGVKRFGNSAESAWDALKQRSQRTWESIIDRK